jgi:ABC-type transport system substrate-binding protein
MNYLNEVIVIAVHRVTALPDSVIKDELEAKAFKGSHMSAAGGFVPPGIAGHSPGIGLVYDPDLVRRLLSKAGYPNGKGFPEIARLPPTASEDERIIPFLRSSWRENLGLGGDQYVIV